MVAMSENDNAVNGSEPGGDDFPWGELEADVYAEMDTLKLIKSKSGWSAIVLPLNEMPGDRVRATLGSLFSGAPVGMSAIDNSLDFLRAAIIESTETEGGAKLSDLAWGEWMELLEQWTNG